MQRFIQNALKPCSSLKSHRPRFTQVIPYIDVDMFGVQTSAPTRT